MGMKLTPRLEMAAQLLTRGGVLADVGTDHAYLPAALLARGWLDGAIATDIAPGPLERAGETVRRAGLAGRVQLRLGPGLEPVAPEECTAVAIAGMGGETICEILQNAPWTRAGRHALVLQPMTAPEKLRAFLYANGYAIEQERLAREGEKIYLALRVKGGGRAERREERDCLLSPALAGDPLRDDYYGMLAARYARAATGIRQAAQNRALRPDEEYVLALWDKLRPWTDKEESR